MRRSLRLLLLIALIALTFRGTAVTPLPEEFRACRNWADRVFATNSANTEPSYLKLLYQDVADGVTRGRSWRGTPFQLGEKTYSHGLAFNATKYLLVHLNKPGVRFTAEIGLENNDDTRRGEAMGQGSVAFQVLMHGTNVFSSPVLKRRDGPYPLDIQLHGAREFELRVTDAGDGRGWDQALWAAASIHLEDGTSLRLQDVMWLEDANVDPSGFSFTYGGTNSSSLIKNWSRTVHEKAVDSVRTERELAYRDPQTGLELNVEATQFKDFPAVEWVVQLRNSGTSNTPLIEALQAFDGVLPVSTSGQTTLHWAKGAVASWDDFAPQETVFKPGQELRLQPGGGRSSSQVLPFFNIEGADGGVIAAVGWSGEWAAQFSCGSNAEVTMKAGMEHTHFVLYPRESIRTPRMLLLFYEGDRWQGQNLLRQFLLTHHRPLKSGNPLVAPITCGNWGGTRADVHLDNIQKIIQHQLPIDYYWIDAEWFGQGGWPVNVGNWEVKKALYPDGFKPLSDALRTSGRELMLWFEPERVYKGTTWFKEHHPWLIDTGGDNSLFNLGLPEARRFLVDFISAKIKEFGLGCYRQDFNMDPLPYWKAADAPDRQGITEIRHIEGLYAFWDELLQRCPGLIIDNCASGGRRIDLETVGRATPFWRTDGPRDAVAHQCHTYGLLPWVPLSATSQDRPGDDYEFRSSMCSALCLNWWVSGDAPAEKIPADFPYAWAQNTLAQYLKLRELYYGDFYPLTDYSQALDTWMAYQLNRPDLGKTMVVVLRRPRSPYQAARFALHGLVPGASYRLTDADGHNERLYSGSELLKPGLEVDIEAQPGSAWLTLTRQ